MSDRERYDELVEQSSLGTAAAKRIRARTSPSSVDEVRRRAGATAGLRWTHRWWDGLEDEYFWLEVTARHDVGTDLNAPQLDERGTPHWSYSLLCEASDGDVVFHFHQQEQAIVGYSVVRGEPWDDLVVWGAHGTSARGREIAPYPRPGWRRGLQKFTRLAQPVTLDDVRAREADVVGVRDALEQSHGAPLYFPFVPYRGQPLRTFQGYLLKLPSDLLRTLGLPRVPRDPETSLDSAASATEAGQLGVGMSYRSADEDVAVSRADPMYRDPALVERGLKDHRATQNLLASALAEAGLVPLSPAGTDPDWDVAWRAGDAFFVAEVKSTNPSNEERQLRLGLGQVLRYRHQLATNNKNVVAVLVVDRAPRDAGWSDLCESLGVRFVWPGNWNDLGLERANQGRVL